MSRPLAAALSLSAALSLTLSGGCATVSQVHAPEEIPPTGEAMKTREDKALAYSVAVPINARPEVVWSVLTDGEAFDEWNSTVESFEGTIALDETVELVSVLDPGRTFSLTVTEFMPGERLVWEDGNGMFKGVRTYTLLPGEGGGTVFVMEEVLSGAMLGSIEKKLPDFRASFTQFAADLKAASEAKAG